MSKKCKKDGNSSSVLTKYAKLKYWSQVDTRSVPAWLKKYKVGSGRISYRGERFSYSILSKEFELRLPGFVGFPQGHLFISEEVPEDYRKPILIHEFVEFTEFAGQVDLCRRAVVRELFHAPKGEEYSRYLEYRKTFFERLIEFYRDSNDVSDEFKMEIQGSYELLKKLIAQLEIEDLPAECLGGHSLKEFNNLDVFERRKIISREQSTVVKQKPLKSLTSSFFIWNIAFR